jgi:hypothetical protein
MTVVEQLKRAKDFSDQNRFDEKAEILRRLIKERPKEFFIDSAKEGIVGITHRPSGFQLHLLQKQYPYSAQKTACALATFRMYKKALNLDLDLGDTILVGRFKNKPVVVKELGTDELGQPTVNGRKLLSCRLKKKMPKKQKEAADESWIGVDLDGTLAKYDGWKGPDVIGAPIQKMVARVQRAIGRGKNVKIFTARVSGDNTGIARRAIRKWCRQTLGLELPITCIKDRHCTDIWDDIAKKVYKNTGSFQKRAVSYRAENIRKLLLGDRQYPVSYLHGEMDEFNEALESGDRDSIEEELQDVMFASQMLATSRGGKDRRVIGAGGKIKEFLRRRDAAIEMFKERGVPFSVDYLAGGSNLRKPEKIMKFFEAAKKPITPEEAQDFSTRYSEWQPPSAEKAAMGKSACGDMLEYFQDHPGKFEEYKNRQKAKKEKKEKKK